MSRAALTRLPGTWLLSMRKRVLISTTAMYDVYLVRVRVRVRVRRC